MAPQPATATPRTVYVTVDFHERKRPGQPRRLKFDANAFADLEEATGLGIGALMHREMSFALIRQFICHGLRHEEPGLTPQRAGLLVQGYINAGHALEDLAIEINRAILASGMFRTRPKDDDEDEEEALDATADPTPPRSSSSDGSEASGSVSESTGSPAPEKSPSANSD